MHAKSKDEILSRRDTGPQNFARVLMLCHPVGFFSSEQSAGTARTDCSGLGCSFEMRSGLAVPSLPLHQTPPC